LYAILFFAGSVLALKRQADNVGHDAHLGGAILGLWTTAVLEPEIVRLQPKLFLAISGAAILLFVYLVKNPLFLPLSSFLPAWPRWKPKRRKPARPPDRALELDAVLEKISKSGIHSLSREERALLNSTSEKYRRQSGSEGPES